MKVFVAGATGAMGKQLVPQLVDAGHRVVGTTRSEAKQGALWELGANRWWLTHSMPTRSRAPSPRRSPM